MSVMSVTEQQQFDLIKIINEFVISGAKRSIQIQCQKNPLNSSLLFTKLVSIFNYKAVKLCFRNLCNNVFNRYQTN